MNIALWATQILLGVVFAGDVPSRGVGPVAG